MEGEQRQRVAGGTLLLRCGLQRSERSYKRRKRKTKLSSNGSRGHGIYPRKTRPREPTAALPAFFSDNIRAKFVFPASKEALPTSSTRFDLKRHRLSLVGSKLSIVRIRSRWIKRNRWVTSYRTTLWKETRKPDTRNSLRSWRESLLDVWRVWKRLDSGLVHSCIIQLLRFNIVPTFYIEMGFWMRFLYTRRIYFLRIVTHFKPQKSVATKFDLGTYVKVQLKLSRILKKPYYQHYRNE